MITQWVYQTLRSSNNTHGVEILIGPVGILLASLVSVPGFEPRVLPAVIQAKLCVTAYLHTSFSASLSIEDETWNREMSQKANLGPVSPLTYSY